MIAEKTVAGKRKEKKGAGFEEDKGEGEGLELRRRWMATREGEGSACSVEGAFIHKSQGAWGYPAKNRAGSWKVCQPLLRRNGNKLVSITAKMLRTCWGTNAKTILNCTLQWSSPCPLWVEARPFHDIKVWGGRINKLFF
jgi:hypothetical protein